MVARDPLAASRRLSLALGYRSDGDLMAAESLLAQAAELDDSNPAIYFAWGECLEALHRSDDAIVAFRQALLLDPPDRHGATARLALLGALPMPAQLPPAHVAAIFDDYAPRFDQALTEKLAYRGPALLQAALSVWLAERHDLAVLDLGCGTGLSAIPFKAQAKRLEGIDLSAAMLARAKARGLYDALHQGDLCQVMAALDQRWDLILAADVLVYCGELSPLFAQVGAQLAADGRFAFTTEAGAEPWHLGPKGRFAHGRDYLTTCLQRHRLTALSCAPVATRAEAGQPVSGWLVVAAIS